jgi:hypothetical protein
LKTPSRVGTVEFVPAWLFYLHPTHQSFSLAGMRSKIYLILVLLALSVSSCIFHLGAGLHTRDITYLTRPVYRGDSARRSATYISGHGTLSQGYLFYSDLNQNYSLLASLHRAHTWRYGTVAYGGFGYGGALLLDGRINQPPPLQVEAGTYPFYGLGLRGAYSFSWPISPRFDWRVLGIDASLSREFGPWAALRQRLPELTSRDPHGRADDWVFFPDPYLVTAGLTTEFCLKSPRRDLSFHVRSFMGRSLGGYPRFYPEIALPVRNTTFILQDERISYSFLMTQLAYQFSWQLGCSFRLVPRKSGKRI